jgi:hypothetical protein
MLPMLLAYAVGRGDVGIPLGQAGFLMAALPLAKDPINRLSNGVIFLVFGLGLYLVGGTVVFNFWPAIIFTFFVSFALSFMSGWRMASMLSFTFFSVYAAGLNVTFPDTVTKNFYAFSVAVLWCSAISFLPWWQGRDLSGQKMPSLVDQVKTGFRMGIGTVIAFSIASSFAFAKLGWAPSATANIVRYDEKVSKQRAKLRVLGTVVGAIGVGVFFILVPNVNYWVIGAFIITVTNGLFDKLNKWGYFPFYTTVILILYSLADPSKSTATTINRIAYNLVGVIVAYIVIIYSFPRLFRWLDSRAVAKIAKDLEK